MALNPAGSFRIGCEPDPRIATMREPKIVRSSLAESARRPPFGGARGHGDPRTLRYCTVQFSRSRPLRRGLIRPDLATVSNGRAPESRRAVYPRDLRVSSGATHLFDHTRLREIAFACRKSSR